MSPDTQEILLHLEALTENFAAFTVGTLNVPRRPNVSVKIPAEDVLGYLWRAQVAAAAITRYLGEELARQNLSALHEPAPLPEPANAYPLLRPLPPNPEDVTDGPAGC